VRSDEPDLSDAVVTATATPASVRVPNMDMAQNLIGIFQPESRPAVTFTSTRVLVKEGWGCELSGDFTLTDVTRSVSWDVTFNGPEGAAAGHPGFTARTSLDRPASGFGGEETLHGSAQLDLGRHVEATCNIRLGLE